MLISYLSVQGQDFNAQITQITPRLRYSRLMNGWPDEQMKMNLIDPLPHFVMRPTKGGAKTAHPRGPFYGG